MNKCRSEPGQCLTFMKTECKVYFVLISNNSRYNEKFYKVNSYNIKFTTDKSLF